jgi:AcrR family transcriptional regulator
MVAREKKVAPTSRSGRGEAAREALVKAALALFAERGFAATSTRQIAARAGVNISLISYHFGGKEGLRRACAAAIVERMRRVAAPALSAAQADLTPKAAEQSLKVAVGSMVDFLLSGEEARPFVDFILREMSDPGPAFEVLYEELFCPIHMAVCRIWGTATGSDPESAETRIAVFAAIGQVVYFRLARPLIRRRLDWRSFGAAEVRAILDIILANFEAQLRAARIAA